MPIDAFVNQHCPNCDVALSIRADDVRVTASDDSDDDLDTGLYRISAVWSCDDCTWIHGHTWYVDEIELSEASMVPWVGDLDGVETCIVVGPQDEIEHDWGERVAGGRV